jgi:CarD family transcriptional regulator
MEDTMLEFQVGDKAVYPAQGVAEVMGIDSKEISGKIHKFYVLKVLESEMRILVPVEKAAQVGLRGVVQEEQIREVYDILKEKEIHIDKQTWNRRYRGFMEKIKTGSLFEVAEVFRDLYRLKSTKTLSFGERRMLDTAKNLIVKELSVAKNTTEVKVEKELERIFSA